MKISVEQLQRALRQLPPVWDHAGDYYSVLVPTYPSMIAAPDDKLRSPEQFARVLTFVKSPESGYLWWKTIEDIRRCTGQARQPVD